MNLVSVAGTVAFAPAGAYAAAKHAQLAFSRSLAAALRGSGIGVHSVLPGFVETEGFPQKGVLGSRLMSRFVIHLRGSRRRSSHAVEKGKREITVPWFPYRLVSILQALAPGLMARLRRGLRLQASRVGVAPATRPRHGAAGSLRLARDVPADLDLEDRRRHPRDSLALLALEPDEVEVAAHLAALAHDLVRRHDEVVRLEEAADVGVRQKPRVGRVARPLEAVLLEAAERVDVAQLVGEEDPSPRPATRASSDTTSSGRRAWWSTRRQPTRSKSP